MVKDHFWKMIYVIKCLHVHLKSIEGSKSLEADLLIKYSKCLRQPSQITDTCTYMYHHPISHIVMTCRIYTYIKVWWTIRLKWVTYVVIHITSSVCLSYNMPRWSCKWQPASRHYDSGSTFCYTVFNLLPAYCKIE